MTTYAETKGEAPFDWNAFLNQETITEEEWKEAFNLAANWVTCACGNLCDAIPRDKYDFPKDQILIELGVEFAGDICDKDISSAKITLQRIEERSAQVLWEIKYITS